MPCKPLDAIHCQLLAEIVASEQPDSAAPESVSHTDRDGRVLTVDQGAGTWAITAHRDGDAQWLTIASPDGTVVAQRDTDLADAAAVAVGMYVLWGWAVIGPEVF
ncbi:hypothetical protein GS449_14070 [Rhodococcus hoagii]|nr:hypothetical protein [Prescottella equi]